MAKAEQEKTLAAVLVERWEQVSRKIEELAEELPEEKFEWRPQDGVRSCGEAARHVAFWNRYVADSLRGKEAREDLNELPAAEYPTKAKALGALRESARDVAAALREQRTLNLKTAEMVMMFLEHTSEHYGQLAVYARLRNVTPPASRG